MPDTDPSAALSAIRERCYRDGNVIDLLRLALALERRRAEAATQAGAVTKQIVDGLVKLAPEGSCPEVRDITSALTGEPANPPAPPAGTGEGP